MVQFSTHTVYSGVKMQNSSSKTGRGVTVNGTVSTLKRPPRSKISSNRQERGSCSSTASCPVFSGCQSDLDEDPPSRCPSSLSSPTLHGSVSTSGVAVKSSLSSRQGSVSSLKSFPTSSTLQSSNFSLCSSSPSLRSSSSSHRSSSEDDSWDTNSWSSGATCLLRSSIKQHSEEVFRVRAGSGCRPEGTSDSETGYQNSDSCQDSVLGLESHEGVERIAVGRRDSSHSLTSSQGTSVVSTISTDLKQKIEEKLKFSQFLDEVTCRVLDPECLEAFGAFHQKETPQTPTSTTHSDTVSPWLSSIRDSLSNGNEINGAASVCQWPKCLPSCKILDANEILRRTQEESAFIETSGRTYLETDIDRVRREDEINSTHARERELEKRCSQESSCRTLDRKKSSSPVLNCSDGAPRPPYRSTSLPRPVSSNTVCDEDTHGSSCLLDQKEDLRKRLTLTTRKLQLLENEFASTRQYLETELRRAQDELEKFTEKLRRIQSSYAALQRINQDLEDKIQRTMEHHEEEKRALSREIVVLKNHLMEAKITIQKLREDNDLYRKDCNLAAQLLQCGKSPYRVHKLSELPIDFQERVNCHMEKQDHGRNIALRNYHSDAVPTAIIGKVLEKPEPVRSCPVTRSPTPQTHDAEHLSRSGTSDKLQRRVIYKTSDLYCSDTALYCPTDERRRDRWPERRQSVDVHARETDQIRGENSTDSNPEDEGFYLNFLPHEEPFHGFTLPASSSYSSFSAASEEKAHVSSFMDWRERKNSSSYEKDSLGFPKSLSFQQVAHSSQNGGSPGYYSELYHIPHLSPSSGVHGDGRGIVDVTEDDLTGRWRQRSVEDVNSFPFGRVSPFSLSEQHFVVGPSKIKPFSSFQERDDVFHTRKLDPCFSASAGSSPVQNPKSRSLNLLKTDRGLMLCSKDGGQRSKSSCFMSVKEQQNTTDGLKKGYESLNSSVESLHQSLKASGVQHHTKDLPSLKKTQYQKSGNTGLSRKDSLTKAQLYGTLLN
ncbi:brain-enriched guanylate kinase-associated protein-like [Myxocyprinus asiaticus]|uniref:brain-enriched guanylate kinase-associated protein-like n=1 Tax=Myxocyprinus asiaticus TaxID=70543 RepID=UPI0022226896|nr:brain-enriched guanylate kinase-associated protein-like [Myxocyprinus asiaticus]